MFETGIKGDRPARAVPAGRQDRPVRRRRRGQDRHHHGASSTTSHEARRVSVFGGVGRTHARGQRPVARVPGVGRHRHQGHVEVARRAGLRTDDRAARRRRCAWVSRRSPWPSTSATPRARTYSCSSTTSSLPRRPAPKVSALLGRMPSAVGYQPTPAVEMGQLQERITSTKKGSITSVQAIYVPADDYTDPARPPRSRTSTRPPTCRARSPSSGIYPAVDPLRPRREHASLDPRRHRRGALQRGRNVKQVLPALHRTCRTSLPSRASESCLKRSKGSRCRARARSSASCRSPSSWPRSFTAPARASTSPSDETIPRLQGNRGGQARHAARAGVLPAGHHRRRGGQKRPASMKQ